jgi:hypothetical protein
MTNARGSGGEQVPGGSFKELQHFGILKPLDVRNIDDDGRPGQNIGQPFTGQRVDASAERGGYGLVTVLAELRHDLRADKTGTTDDYDHEQSSESRPPPAPSAG